MKRMVGCSVMLIMVLFEGGCQVCQTGTETRTDEQMLDVSFENARAEEVFGKIVQGTERQTDVKSRVGTSSVSLYSKSETVAFNAHCNDHIRAMDTNGDLVISQKEAEDYYKLLSEQGKIAHP